MNWRSITLACVIMATNGWQGPPAVSEERNETLRDFEMDELQWKHRPLLIFAPAKDTANFKRQLKVLKEAKAGMRERDMVVVWVTGETSGEIDQRLLSEHNTQPLTEESSRRLRKRYEIPSREFAAILVGKDGTVKLRRDEPVSIKQLFELIDSMPMRQREMRQDR